MDDEDPDFKPVEVKLESELMLSDLDETDDYATATPEKPDVDLVQGVEPASVTEFVSSTSHDLLLDETQIKVEKTEDEDPLADPLDDGWQKTSPTMFPENNAVLSQEGITVKLEDGDDSMKKYSHDLSEGDTEMRVAEPSVDGRQPLTSESVYPVFLVTEADENTKQKGTSFNTPEFLTDSAPYGNQPFTIPASSIKPENGIKTEFCDIGNDVTVSLLEEPSTLERVFSCNQCSTLFNSSDELKKHEVTHSDKRAFHCHRCPARFLTSFELAKHSLSHANDISCDSCPAVFKTKEQFDKHWKIHEGTTCKLCSKQFEKSDELKQHLLTHAEKFFSCNLCPARYKTDEKFAAHLQLHNNKKSFVCTVCSFVFKKNKELRAHLKWHSDVKPFSCDYCTAAFKVKSGLLKHLLIHSNTRAFSCNLCSAKIKDKHNFKRHLKLHSSTKSFSCAQCSAAFYTKGQIKAHLATHFEDRNFSCNQCSARFKTRDGLRKHALVHSNNTFTCEHCSVAFKYKNSLRRHLVETHRDKSG